MRVTEWWRICCDLSETSSARNDERQSNQFMRLLLSDMTAIGRMTSGELAVNDTMHRHRQCAHNAEQIQLNAVRDSGSLDLIDKLLCHVIRRIQIEPFIWKPNYPHIQLLLSSAGPVNPLCTPGHHRRNVIAAKWNDSARVVISYDREQTSLNVDRSKSESTQNARRIKSPRSSINRLRLQCLPLSMGRSRQLNGPRVARFYEGGN